MTNLTGIAETLTNSLELRQPPIGVCLADSLPEGAPEWKGAVPAGCRFWQEAATRVFATSPRDHELCAIGVYTHNFDAPAAVQSELGAALKIFGELGYVRDEDVPHIPVLASRPRYVIYGPLAELPVDPQVILLFVSTNQSLILSEAAQQIEGGAPPAMGRPACAIIPQTTNSGRAALSLGCCGARAYLDVLADDVALFALPGERAAEYADRIAALASANAVLAQFHAIRRQDVAAGGRPTIQQSLAKLPAAMG
jgi:uncharacterized protein (DUF169 family)